MDRSLREVAGFYLADVETRLGRAVNVVLIALNTIFVFLYVISTFALPDNILNALRLVELALVFLFSIEYIIRLDEADNTFREAISPYTLLDLLVLLPEILILLLPFPQVGFLKVLRVLRIFRFLRFLEGERFSFFGRVRQATLIKARLLLRALSVFFVTAGFVYEAEHAVNSGIQNFWDAFYFAVISITTTGYGEIVAVTTLGRFAIIIGIIGGLIVVRSWLSSLTGSGSGRWKMTCTRCGLERHQMDANYCKRCGEKLPTTAESDAEGDTTESESASSETERTEEE